MENLNVLGSLNLYYGKYQVVATGKLSDAEVQQIAGASISDGDYGLSVALVMASGGTAYIPYSNMHECSKEAGEVLTAEEIKGLTIVKLMQVGNPKPILRAYLEGSAEKASN